MNELPACDALRAASASFRAKFLNRSALASVFAILVLFPALIARRAGAQETAVQFNVLPPDVIVDRLRLSSPDNSSRESALKALFMEAGCGGEHLAEQPIKREKLPNLICTLAGSSAAVILVGAHYDHVKRGEGVVDNWSGAALLASLYQSLSGVPRKHTFVFVGFSGEEEGLAGSTFYVSQLSAEQSANLRVMVNLDALGLGPTKVWIDHSDKEMAHSLNIVANAMKLTVGAVNADNVGDEDSTPFRKRHIPTLMLHSITQDTLSVIRTEKDNLSAIRTDDYYDSYHLLAEYLAFLDTKLD
jgi:hypothetical protein